MAITLLGTSGTPMSTQRTTIDNNFAQTELKENKTNTITSGASETLYLSEKAGYDYIQRQYYHSLMPSTKSGDTVILSSASGKAKYKVNDNGTIRDVVFDRACGNYMTAAQFTELNAIYLPGEILIESDTMREKRGDGNTPWAQLKYTNGITGGKTSGGEWIKLPNGTIMQWGNTTSNTGAEGYTWNGVTLPISFPTKRVSTFLSATTPNDGEWLIPQPVLINGDSNLNQIEVIINLQKTNKDIILNWLTIGY